MSRWANGSEGSRTDGELFYDVYGASEYSPSKIRYKQIKVRI